MNTTPCRTHGLKSGACWRPETERQGLAPRPSHDSHAAFLEFVTHNGTAPVLLNSIIGTPGGRYMRLVIRCELHLRAAPIAPSHHGGLSKNSGALTSEKPFGSLLIANPVSRVLLRECT